MSETTEPATIKDLVERFRKFSFRSETYPINGDGDFVYQFDAAEIAPQQFEFSHPQLSGTDFLVSHPQRTFCILVKAWERSTGKDLSLLFLQALMRKNPY